MKARFLIFIRHFCLLCLASWALEPQAGAQTPLGLNIQMNAGQAQLTVTGAVGTKCQIQWTDKLSAGNRWFHLGFSILTESPSPLTDPASSSATIRFYRAVWTPNTNLVWISPGTFTMGSPTSEALRNPDETQHLVTISRGFWMGKYLVTQADYLSVVGNNPSAFTGDLTRPVEQVSWSDATNYCALRTQQELVAGLIPANYLYRLPTESEWEYAARAGTTAAFYLGSGLHSGQANFYGPAEYDAGLGDVYNPSGISLGTTTPVGSFAASGWGLYDMIGNVWEWCQDWYDTYPTGPVTDPQGASSGSGRVFRGGNWYSYGRYCRSAYRSSAPTAASYAFGFRVVLAPSQ